MDIVAIAQTLLTTKLLAKNLKLMEVSTGNLMKTGFFTKLMPVTV